MQTSLPELLSGRKIQILDQSQVCRPRSSDFSGLMGDLRDLVESLYSVVPVPPQFNQLLVKQDFDKLPDDIGMLRLVEEACSDRNDEWPETARTRRDDTGTGTENAIRIMPEWKQNIKTAE
jgi:hypothetical protein